MLNLTDFEKKMIKGLFKKEKPEIRGKEYEQQL